MQKIIILIIGISVFGIYYYFDYNSDRIVVENIAVNTNLDLDERTDSEDLVYGARLEVKNGTNYRSGYYSGGFPPENEGVCTDVIWRAFKEMGVDLKSEVDRDIKNNLFAYPRVNGKQDRNIDFRRVPNLDVYFKRNHIKLTKEVISGDIENLKQWQPGDIVIFGKPKDHIAIISDKRNKYGVPYIIHNSAPTPREDDWLEYWNSEVSPIIGHYRWKY